MAMPLVGAVAVLALALVSGRSTALAQPLPGQEPGIVAAGFGEASAPASAARLQFQIGPTGFGFGPPPEDVVPPAGAEGEEGAEGAPADATPVVEAGGLPPEAGAGPPSLTADQLEPVVAALVEAGATEENIEVVVPVTSGVFFGPGGPDLGEIRVTVEEPDAETLNGLVEAAQEATSAAGLDLFYIGARYEADDCETLIQEARADAVADAQARAEGLAEAIGASLGDLVQASESPFFGPSGAGSCVDEAQAAVFGGFGPFGPGTDPPFDPSAEAEAEVYIQVTLTYAIEGTE